MKACLDTCAYSRLMCGNQELRSFLEACTILFVPVVVLGELHAGFGAGSRTRENERQLLAFLETPGVRIQDATWDVARRYALLVNFLRKAGRPIPANDIWIAATALELGARLVTYDAHFAKIPGLIVESP